MLQNSEDPLSQVKAKTEEVTKDVAEFGKKVSQISGERKWSVFCYFPVVNVVVCALCAVRMVKSPLCRFHARQGIILFAGIFVTVFSALISPVLSLMLWGVILLLHVVGAFIAYNGSDMRIPIIGQLALRIPEYYIFELLTGKKPEDYSVNQ